MLCNIFSVSYSWMPWVDEEKNFVLASQLGMVSFQVASLILTFVYFLELNNDLLNQLS